MTQEELYDICLDEETVIITDRNSIYKGVDFTPAVMRLFLEKLRQKR